ncbi:MAG: VCBS repeat-containing protein [Myxococcales bacterium]
MALCMALGCGGEKKAETPAPEAPTPSAPAAETKQAQPQPSASAPAAKRGLVLALSRFSGTTPQPARADLLTPQAGLWKVESFDDADSNVFHKAFALSLPGKPATLVTLGGMKAAVKGWKRAPMQSETWWTEAFGGKFDRMRDAEVGDVDGDGLVDIAVATHDQGVVAYLKQLADGKWQVEKLDREPDTFIHEIELGDLNGDGALEIYATPSEPNRLDAGAQSGRVVRYVPKLKEGRKVVADLGKRHAKEILVKDVDGDGRDELYVAVEALTEGSKENVKVVEPVEIRRFDANTPADKGKVVARIQDRFCRFLTAGDVDGDGKKEMVAAAFRSGVWLLRPGKTAKDEWTVENIETDSSGFEHAALLTDLDEDGKDELYVAADDQGELRRYVWKDGKPVRETILKRDNPRETWTWNIMPLPAEWLSK